MKLILFSRTFRTPMVLYNWFKDSDSRELRDVLEEGFGLKLRGGSRSFFYEVYFRNTEYYFNSGEFALLVKYVARCGK